MTIKLYDILYYRFIYKYNTYVLFKLLKADSTVFTKWYKLETFLSVL